MPIDETREDNDHMTQPTATTLSQSIELQLAGQPDVPNRWGSGSIRPDRVVFYYLNDPITINAILFGSWIRPDGEATDAPLEQLYRGTDDGWPDWLTTMAREHAPATVPVSAEPEARLDLDIPRLHFDTPTDQTALCERIADVLATADGWKWAPGLKVESPTYQGYLSRAAAVLAVLPSADHAAEIEALHEQHKASLRRADEINNELMEEVQRYAAGEERPVLWSVYNQMHLRALEAETEVERLRGLTAGPCVCGETSAPGTVHRTDGPCYIDETAGPEAQAETDGAEKMVRGHVLALHQIGEQLAGIESWFWQHLADVRDVNPAAAPVGQTDEEA